MQILNNTEWKTLNHDLRLSSLQCGLSSASDRSLTPESSRSLSLRSSSPRLEDVKLRTEDRTSQLPSDMLQTLSLKNYEDENKMKKKVILVFKCIHVAVRFNRFNNILHWHSYWFVLTTQKCVSTLWFRLKYYKCKAKMTHRWN